jgi:hypothetical protein
MRRVFVWLLALGIGIGSVGVLPTKPARAESADDAAKLFDKGLSLYKRKKFLEAADAFHEAYVLAPTGDALFNAGRAWEGAGMRAVAATAYARAIEEGIRGNGEAKATASLETLQKRLGKVELSMPPGSSVRVDVLSLAGEKVTLYVEPGSSTLIVVLKSGKRVTREIETAPGDTLAESIEEPKLAAPPPKPAPKPEPPKSNPWRTAGWVSLGVAGVATAGAIVFGLNAWSARDDFRDSGQTDADARERAVSNMHLTNVCWVIAGVGAATGGVLLFYVAPNVDASGPEKTGAITVSGQF